MSENLNELKLGVFLSYISKVIVIIIGLVYTPLMIRLLGQSEYGLYNIAASFIAYLGILNFGFGSAYMRFYSRFKIINEFKGKELTSKINNLNGMFLILFSVLGLIAICFGVILALNVEYVFGKSLTTAELKIASILMMILVFNLGISFPNIVFDTYIQANEKFVLQNSLLIMKQISTPLVSLPLLISGYGSVGLVLGTTLVSVVIQFLTAWYCTKKMRMKFAFNDLDQELFKEVVIYSSFIFVNMVVDQINNNVDKTILGRYQGTVSVAIYSVASNLVSYFTQISVSISTVFIPRVHRMEAQNSSYWEITNLFTKVGRIQFILLILVATGFLFFGRPFIGIWAGKNYYDSYIITVILMFSILIPLIQNLGIEIQRAKNKHQFRSWAYLIMAIGNIILSIPLSIKYGAIGAAIGTALSYLIGNGLVMNWYNHFKIKIDMFYFWKEIAKFLPALIAPVLYGIFINYYVNLYTISNLIIYGTLYLLIFAVSFYTIGLNEYEKKIVKNPFS